MSCDQSESSRASTLAPEARTTALGAIAASIAHELNQPLGAVVLNAQTCLRYLRRETPDIQAAIAAAERVVHDGTRASEIVRETRALISKDRARDERVCLNGLIKEAAELFVRDIDAIGAKLTLQLPVERIELSGHRVALRQALTNLLSNALTAVADQPLGKRRVSVTLTSDEKHILICVRDCGPGISPENLERIFAPFFTTRDGGMGMGLAISRSAIEAHGGTLSARNDPTGGAIFECRVPRGIEHSPRL